MESLTGESNWGGRVLANDQLWLNLHSFFKHEKEINASRVQ